MRQMLVGFVTTCSESVLARFADRLAMPVRLSVYIRTVSFANLTPDPLGLEQTPQMPFSALAQCGSQLMYARFLAA